MSEGLARADALLRLAQAQRAAPPPPYAPDSWVSYGGGEAILLAIVLLVVASGFAYAGKRLRAPLAITRPGGTVAGFMIATWLLAIYTVCVAWLVYELQVKQAYPGFVAPRVRVGTFLDAPVTFFVILYLTRRWGWKVALASAVIGTAAAWNIFEFPFDLIIMARTNPPIPTHPMLYPAYLPAVVPGPVLNGVSADVATFDAGDRVRRLRGGGDVCGIRRLGRVRVRLSRETAAARAERHFKDPVLRSGDHAVCLEGRRGSLWS
jgi:hypothetical protein